MKIHWLGEGQEYGQVLELQEKIWAEQLADPDRFFPTLLLLEHAPVYTMGRIRDQSSLGDREKLPYPVVEINRGGQATYHGPGQLVGYPIANLEHLGRDIHAFVDAIETSLIAACADYGVHASQREGLVGIWVENRKLASIGVGVRRWVTMHGFAINMTRTSVVPFHYITPCGLADVSMTSLEGELIRLGSPVPLPSSEEFGHAFARHFDRFLRKNGPPGNNGRN